jgi:hypothetical protein
MQFYQISDSMMVGGSIAGKFFSPASVNCNCPSCGRAVNFRFAGCRVDTNFWLLTHQVSCGGCSKKIKFFGNYKTAENETERHVLSLFVFAEKGFYLHVPDFSQAISEKLNRSFVSSVESFNSGNYSAATVMGRRTLEGLFKSLVEDPKKHRNLNSLIEAAAKEKDLTAPLHRLSHAVRDGGNLGAHFDLDREPTAEVAKMLVELVQYLIEFLYVLPTNIETLEKALDTDA